MDIRLLLTMYEITYNAKFYLYPKFMACINFSYFAFLCCSFLGQNQLDLD